MSGPCLGLPGSGQQCDEFALPGRPRCAVHDAIMRGRKAQRHEDTRGSARQRGFDAEYWANRRAIAKTASACAMCGTRLPRDAKGNAIFELDHIIARADWRRTHGTYAGVNDASNLQPLCRDCHSAKTSAENAKRNSRPLTARRFA